MSANTDTHDGHGHHGHDAHHDDGSGHGTMHDYVIGFVASVVLTVIPFWLVMAEPIASKGLTALIVMLLGMVQILVHMFYFLHMNPRSEGGWTMMSAIFAAVLVVITLLGSMWVMYHLNTHMMPMTADHMPAGQIQPGQAPAGQGPAGHVHPAH